MSTELYNDGKHICVAFRDLVTGGAVQANQFMIFDEQHAALLDPGGELTYTRLFIAISHYMNVKNLDYVIASHQDPDTVASVSKWLVGTDCQVVVPALWERFVPHFTRPGKMEGRIITIPDAGASLTLGGIQIKALPAHFMHAEGNYCFYDPKSRLLFSGDIGANLAAGEALNQPATELAEVLPFMEGFHRRYINSNRVCRFWAQMIRTLDVEMIVPQHGRALAGRTAVADFLDWIEDLECGVDLMTQEDYRVPPD